MIGIFASTAFTATRLFPHDTRYRHPKTGRPTTWAALEPKALRNHHEGPAEHD